MHKNNPSFYLFQGIYSSDEIEIMLSLYKLSLPLIHASMQVTPPCSPCRSRRSERESPIRSPGREKDFINKVLSRSNSLAGSSPVWISRLDNLSFKAVRPMRGNYYTLGARCTHIILLLLLDKLLNTPHFRNTKGQVLC